jgi:nitroreductase
VPVAFAAGMLLAALWTVSALGGGLLAVATASTGAIQAGEAAVGLRPQRFGAASRLGSYAARSVLGLPLRSLVEIAGLAAAGATVGLSVALVAAAIAASGPTLLAAAVAAGLQPIQAALLAASAIASFAFAVAALLGRHESQRPERWVLRSAGWSEAEIAGVARLGRLMIAVPATGLASTIILGLAAPLGVSALTAVAIASVVCLGVPLLLGPWLRRWGSI